MIKLVLWDIGNVLVKADHNLTYQYLITLGVAVPKAQSFFAHESYRLFARGQITGIEFCIQQAQNLKRNVSLDDVFAAHQCHITESDRATCNLVSRSRVPVAFATNTNSWQDLRIHELLGGLDLYNPVWTFRSNGHGMLKADAGCMELVAIELYKRCGVNPSEILLIDDSLANRRAADEAGLSTYNYTPNAGAAACEQFLLSQKLLK